MKVFAVEDSTAQFTWRSLPPGRMQLRVGGSTISMEPPDGPGGTVVSGLAPGTTYDVDVRTGGRSWHRLGRLTTLRPPPGRELCRIATVSDVHIGAPEFGILPPARDLDATGGPAPERCLRAALAELKEWGADLVVVKGDITERGAPEEWAAAVSLLAGCGLPVEAVIGNHDVKAGSNEGRRAFADAGLHLVDQGTRCLDLPGVRLVLADTTIPGVHGGTIERSGDEVVDHAAGAPSGALVALHHHIQRTSRPTRWPPGIPGPEGRRFLDRLAAAQPAALVTSGHTHRHRARRHGPLMVTEVGSTKDYPGTWAGYVVHEGGVRQVVRRVVEPTALRWTEATGRSYLGAWAAVAPGPLSARCFSLAWSRR